MIELMTPKGVTPMEIRLSGKITDDDYEDVLVPALEAAIEAHDRVRLLVEIADFKGYELDALVEDARIGLKHWNGFDRVAVVSGVTLLNRVIKGFSLLYPCPVAVFAPGEADEARRWLRESLGAIHQEDLGDGVLRVALMGKLEASAYEGEAEDLNAFVRAHDGFRMLLDLREFDGWQGLGAIGRHFRLVRDHKAALRKAAIVGDAGWQKLAVRAGREVLGVDAEFFDADSFDAAVAWLKS
ncbi:STAS/SEC14 domain-containing protein [Sagittula salina]|uniref:STAS/SEC14 domain-containing protein n=1 Tax=Sagittula salina TaxID=2820268 RepID=A0A940S252_9RHOB|nr:STAS/SEC14 domain-containing protein [Sagittula salina]MBP0481265.1 STAS/SEC14 domain-containing protein [Sagittula salina]